MTTNLDPNSWPFKMGIYDKLTCTICGTEGVWPFISFEESHPDISARPKDCAAVFLLGNEKADDLHPRKLKEESVRHEVTCPRCYRLGTAEHGNGEFLKSFERENVETIHSYLTAPLPSRHKQVGDVMCEMLRENLGSSTCSFTLNDLSLKQQKDYFHGVAVQEGPMHGPGSGSISRIMFELIFDARTNKHDELYIDMEIGLTRKQFEGDFYYPMPLHAPGMSINQRIRKFSDLHKAIHGLANTLHLFRAGVI